MIKTLRLASHVVWLTARGRRANATADYDQVSDGYDESFSQVMGSHALRVLDQMQLERGQSVLELACGTGHLTVDLARRLEQHGTITAVDMSAGMLAVAQRKLANVNGLVVNFRQAEMLDALRTVSDASMDSVVCGWAICYSQPARLLREVARVLRPGGEVGIIETRHDALATLQAALRRVVMDDPSLLRRYLTLNLPRNASTLSSWFQQAGLEPAHCWEGEQELPCHNADQALQWVQRSGAAAGFMDAFDRSRESEVLNRLQLAIQDGAGDGQPVHLSHTFVAGVARRVTVA